MTVFGTKDGLPHNAVHALCQDRNGYLWVGTAAGLSRYNGYRFEHYLQADQQRIGHVNSLFETPEGVLWIGAETGMFMAIHGKVHPVSSAFGGKFKQVRSFLWDSLQHRLWFACATGPYYFTKQQIETLRHQPAATHVFPEVQPEWETLAADDLRAFSMALDGRNRLWVGNANRLICCENNTCRLVWKSPTNDAIDCLLSAGADSMYFGGHSSTLFGYFNGKVEQFADSMYYVTDLFEHNKERFFFSAGEMYRITREGVVKIWDHSIRVGISDVIVDRENNVWVATWEGLIKISSRFFEQMPLDIYPELEEVYGIGVAKDGAPLFGANHGKAYQLTSGLKPKLQAIHERICPNANINDFYTDPWGRLWMATEYEGLAVLESGKTRLLGKKDGLYDEGLFDLLPSKNGGFWAIGDAGASKIHFSERPIHRFAPQIEACRMIKPPEGLTTFTCGVEDPTGNLWLGGNRGLYKNTLQGLVEFHLFSDKILIISDMNLDQTGRLWISTLGNGLFCCGWNGVDWQLQQIFTEKEGLFSDNLLAVLPDSKGRIWVGYGFGLGLLEMETGKGWNIRYFNDRDGLFPNGCHRMKIKEAPDGVLWTVSTSGVCHFRPDRFTRNQVAPIVSIRELQLFDGYYDCTSYCEALDPETGLPENLTLPHFINNLRFIFDGLSLTNPDDNRFRFMLAGVDKNWRTPEHGDLRVTYPKLPPGAYTFYVEAANSDGIWVHQPTTFQFVILAPFWQKTWFWVMLLGAFVALTIIIATNRIRRIRQQETEKSRIQAQMADLKVQALRAQINPHFIFNCLAGIQECVLQEQFMAANDYLTRFARLLRLILERSDKSFISLQQELEMLYLYLDLENTRLGQQIEYRINTDSLEEDQSLLLPAFIIQPFVENAIWHGLMHKTGVKQLKIDISTENGVAQFNKSGKKVLSEEDMLIIEITDNGIGRVKSAEIRRNKISNQQSKGIGIIEERLQLIHRNASIRYEDLYDEAGNAAGTKVRMEIPLNTNGQA
ncbi:MAG: histidine kinase [Saprospiraceae bacterium]|nr:histidine kinase [Saprospiraceae bacterium]